MKSEFDKQECYFAASNSAEGFVNYFPQIFNRKTCRRIYVVKGGPGTGKSFFMRQVGKRAEEKGYGVTYYYCSSDPASLDGVLIHGLDIGFVDGTAPHVWEPQSVGVFEQILNLGDFWNGDMLAARREKIEQLAEGKRACYDNAYRYLAAYGSVMRAVERDVRSAVDMEKLNRAAARILKKNAVAGEGDRWETALCEAVGMTGRVRFDTYEKHAKKLYSIKDLFGAAYLFTGALADYCRERGIAVRLSYDPVLPERINALELLDGGIVFSLADIASEEATVNMRRFVKNEDYKSLRFRVKERYAASASLMGFAEEELARVRGYHFDMEACFSDAMDFTAKEEFTEAFCTKLFADA